MKTIPTPLMPATFAPLAGLAHPAAGPVVCFPG